MGFCKTRTKFKVELFMITIGEIAKNLRKGQSAVKVKYIIQGLDQYAEQVMPHINIAYVRAEGTGTAVYYKVPSESEKNVIYDVVIWYNSRSRINSTTAVRIYSNSPGFGYNFAYVFNKQKSLLYAGKYPSIIINRPPKVRNPYETFTFDKHVYACMKKTTKYNLNDAITHFENDKEPEIESFDKKQQETAKLKKELKEQKLRESRRSR